MTDDEKLAALTEAFEKIGVEDPADCARYQLERNVPELARLSFIKAAWDGVVNEGDTGWIQRQLEDFRRDPNGVGNGAGRALERLLKLGAKPEDLTDLVRSMQYETLFAVCYVADNCGDDYRNPLSPKEHWHLVLGEDCPPSHLDVGGLHESVLQMDRTGREMRPRPE